MSFLTGMLLGRVIGGSMGARYHSYSSDYQLRDSLDKNTKEVKKQNDLLQEKNKIEELRLKKEYFSNIDNDTLLKLLEATPKEIEYDNTLKISGGRENKVFIKNTYKTIEYNPSYQDILYEVQQRKLFEINDI